MTSSTLLPQRRLHRSQRYQCAKDTAAIRAHRPRSLCDGLDTKGRQERDFIAAGRQNILEVAVDDPANEIDIQLKDDSRLLR
jgi:hypothetical protein